MYLPLGGVLNAEDLASVNSIVSKLAFQDGRATAGWHAKQVKDNAQATPSAALRQAQRLILDALQRHEVFAAFALPRRVLPPILAKYAETQRYGSHVDDAIMSSADGPLRTDLSLTLYLDEPDAYDGGELVIETPAGEEALKLAAGDAIVYPSTTLHRVEPVTAGERRVAVTWVQSLVRDAARREILFDLKRAQRLAYQRGGKDDLFDLVTKARANLLRCVAEV